MKFVVNYNRFVYEDEAPFDLFSSTYRSFYFNKADEAVIAYAMLLQGAKKEIDTVCEPVRLEVSWSHEDADEPFERKVFTTMV